MARNRNTDTSGRPFDKATIDAVWSKGRLVPNYDQGMWRYDMCGKPLKYSHYGKTNSEHGWEIDHVFPVSKGGSNNLSNLQPLQWDNNRRKGDLYPWSC